MNTTDARAILDRACDRYGGWERWRRIQRIDLAIKELKGPLLTMKGRGRTFRSPHRVFIWPHRCRTVFHNYPYLDSAGVYDQGRVSIEHEPVPDDRIPRSDHRRGAFRGLHKHGRWSHLDAIYFFGYALWHYHTLPFSLTETRILKARQDDAGSRLSVEFPASVDTHSSRQTFYFDATGLILRHDYVADIVGFWARGAHEWHDYRTVEGFPVATRRRVWMRAGRLRLPIPVLSATIGDVAVTLSDL